MGQDDQREAVARRHIALLRGVNVGGNNMISMSKLKAAFVEHGFEDVATYINSGNVLFTSDLDPVALRTACGHLLETELGLRTPVCLIPADELAEAVDQAPDWWNKNKESSHNAIFVIPPLTPAQVCATVGPINPEHESVACQGSLIFWSAPLKTYSRTRFSKIIQDKSLYNSITIRNANTTLKLAALARG
ncbi:MAG: DUF1697 domain-containing protein [Propionibacteriaceae bacterium]|jgi:uncharacterized protein (DUF1697 family)|nr:DUF1697 domain-containing protein [Propionibacteriaceae bacterium]